MIPKSKCKHRFLYRIHSRNLVIGVFNIESGGFIGLRRKFGAVYSFEEYHWDNGEPYGTVSPEEELEELPGEIELTESLGTKCQTCGCICEFIFSENVSSTVGKWNHIEKTECKEVIPINIPNILLEEWLHNMETKYGY